MRFVVKLGEMHSGGLSRVAEAKDFGRHVLGCSAAEEDLRYLGSSTRMTFSQVRGPKSQLLAFLCTIVLAACLVR
jgi:hypothetical protein